MTATLLYLTLVVAFSNNFGDHRPSLREAFPRLFRDKNTQGLDALEEESSSHHDEPALYHDERAIWRTLLLGIPDWKEWEFSYITIAVNVILTLLSLDLVYRGPLLHDGRELAFTRVGYVDEATAKILVREPDLSKLPLYVYIKVTDQPQWTFADTIFDIDEETDFTRPIVFTDLKADTAYMFSLSNDLRGQFITAPPRGSPEAKSLTFLTSSCIKANFPYQLFSNSLSIHGLKHLSRVSKALRAPASFMLFLGDFIYVDVPLRLGSTVEHYRSEYRRVYKSPSWRLPGIDMPWLHTLDDHEIANDWAGGNVTAPFPAAADPFLHYHVSVNPPFPPKISDGHQSNTTYFQFTQGPASFFMLDTRRYRTQPEIHSEGVFGTAKPLYGSSASQKQRPIMAPSMLGESQLNDLIAFLTTPEPAGVSWKFVASSVPFTQNWKVGTSDTWGGFLAERETILKAMHFAEASLGVRVVVLSGDRHEFAAIRFPSQQAADHNLSGPHEFSVGPLSMFYLPFRTFKQSSDSDIALAYMPDGNSKIGQIEIFPTNKDIVPESRSTLRYTLWIDGRKSWSYELHSPFTAGQRSNLATWVR